MSAVDSADTASDILLRLRCYPRILCRVFAAGGFGRSRYHHDCYGRSLGETDGTSIEIAAVLAQRRRRSMPLVDAFG